MSEKLTNIANALSTIFAPKLARQFNNMAVLGALIPSEAGGGKAVNFDVEMDGATAGSYAEGADVGSGEFATNSLIPAVVPWSHYRSAFQVSETAFDAAATSANSAQAVMNLLNERVTTSVAKLASVVNGDLWNGTGTDLSGNTNITGFLGGALELTGTYAGISRSAYPLWKGNVLSNGGTPRALTVDLMEQIEASIFSQSGLRPNVIVCDPATLRKYSGLFETNRRIVGEGPISRYDTSTTEYFFKGIPVLRDKDGYAGTMLFLNTTLVNKVYLPNSSMADQDVFKSSEVEMVGSNGDGEENNLALPVKIVPLAKTGDSLKFMLKTVLNLKVVRPNALGYIKDITVT